MKQFGVLAFTCLAFGLVLPSGALTGEAAGPAATRAPAPAPVRVPRSSIGSKGTAVKVLVKSRRL